MKRNRKSSRNVPTYNVPGFWVEGISFPVTNPHRGAAAEHAVEWACSYAAKLAEQQQRLIQVRMVMMGGFAKPVFTYAPEDSIDAMAARRDAHGFVILH